MKKYELSKILGITFIIGVLLTWLIPTGQFSEEGFAIAATNPLGFIDLFRTPLNTFANFIHYAMVFLALGGLYGVMGKTGVYSIIVDKIVKKFKTKKENFLILTSIIFILLSSVLGVNLLIFTLVPFFATILLLLGYNKLTSLVVTVGAMLTGGLGATYSNSINTSLRYFLNVSIHNEIVTRLIFLVIISVLFIMFVLNSTKKEKDEEDKKEEVKIPLYTKNVKKDRNPWPLIIVCGFALILLTLGMFDWAFSFDISFFKNMHESIIGLETNGYPIVANLIGAINAFGNWSMYDLTIFLMIVSVVIAWIYSLKVKDTVDAFVDGAKEMLPVAFYVTMANILFSLIYFGQSGVDIFNTISNFLLGITDKFNMITMSLTSIIGSFFYNDFIQYSNVLGTVVGSIYNNTIIYPKIALILQFMYGLTMFVAPTSILLIAGLSYFGISYKEWLKHIWKYLVKIFAVVLVVLIIVMMFV
ncbi:MAG: hypothetical protein PHI05_01865 [Bacilli bacterium]|nr:hypothetical protein [Bacilli bacterium]MDD4547475.1 hypothetical protein [Bacilli bacterium]